MRLVLISAILIGGCTTERAGQEMLSYDSAGVQIREIGAATAVSPVRLAEQPIVTVGADDAGPDYQFVDIAGAFLLSDGRLVVADRGLNAIRYFDASGTLVGTLGRAGAGPGEFRALQAIGRFSGDSVYALDRQLQRITVFDESGQLAFLVQVAVRVVSVYPLGDGRWIGATAEGYFGGMMDQQAQPGLKRAPAPILVLSADGAVIDTLAAPPGQEQAYIRSGEHMGALPAAFGRILSLAVRGRQLYVATGAFQGFDLYDPDRGWLQSTRLAGTEDLTIRPDDLAAFNNAMLAEMPSSSARAEFSVLLNTVEVPRTKAPVSRIVVDDAGSVWLSEYESPYFGASGWHIIDGEGRYRGRVATPVSLRIQDVRHSKVVGVWRGEDGVQSVRVYPLSVNP